MTWQHLTPSCQYFVSSVAEGGNFLSSLCSQHCSARSGDLFAIYVNCRPEHVSLARVDSQPSSNTPLIPADPALRSWGLRPPPGAFPSQPCQEILFKPTLLHARLLADCTELDLCTHDGGASSIKADTPALCTSWKQHVASLSMRSLYPVKIWSCRRAVCLYHSRARSVALQFHV